MLSQDDDETQLPPTQNYFIGNTVQDKLDFLYQMMSNGGRVTGEAMAHLANKDVSSNLNSNNPNIISSSQIIVVDDDDNSQEKLLDDLDDNVPQQ
jgi:hypothetical protein